MIFWSCPSRTRRYANHTGPFARAALFVPGVPSRSIDLPDRKEQRAHHSSGHFCRRRDRHTRGHLVVGRILRKLAGHSSRRGRRMGRSDRLPTQAHRGHGHTRSPCAGERIPSLPLMARCCRIFSIRGMLRSSQPTLREQGDAPRCCGLSARRYPCARRTRMRLDLTGKRFGKLTAIRPAPDRQKPSGQTYTTWECACECGNTSIVATGWLRSGNTRSCGCLEAESRRNNRTTHGCSRKSGHTPEYKTWRSMKDRCLKKSAGSYARYGARGVSICARWMDFENFLTDMGRKPSPRHTIDRIRSEGNYEPSNCRWATPEEQSRNRKNAIMLSLDGETMSIFGWAERLGVTRRSIASRRSKGWTDEEILTTPFAKKAVAVEAER